MTDATRGRRFGITVGSAFLVLALIWYVQHAQRRWGFPAGAGVTLLALGLVQPLLLLPLERLWMKLAHAMSRVTTPILMALLFFLVLTPVGTVRRWLGHNPVARTKGASYWCTREGSARRSDMRRQF